MLVVMIDLGNLQFGEPHSFKVPLRNTGNEDIVVDKIAVGCTSCTIASLPTMRIPHSNITQLDVVFTPGTTGPHRKSISIIYGDKTLRIEFTANVS